MIGRRGERGSGISVLAARHDDDDDEYNISSIFLLLVSLTHANRHISLHTHTHTHENAHIRRHASRYITISNLDVWLFSWAVWHSCRMGALNQEQTRGRIGPQLRLGNLRVGELHFCPLCTALDQASSLSRKLAYVPGPTFGFVKLLASSGSHCTK